MVRVTRRMLGIRRRVWPFGAEQQFDAAHISGLRLAAEAWQPFREEESSSYNWSEGPIAFEYGDRTVRFGKGLRRKEAHDIVNEIAAVWR